MIFILGALAAVVGILLLILYLFSMTGLSSVPPGFIILAIVELILTLCFFIKLYYMSKKIKSLEKKVERLMHNHGYWWLQD